MYIPVRGIRENWVSKYVYIHIYTYIYKYTYLCAEYERIEWANEQAQHASPAPTLGCQKCRLHSCYLVNYILLYSQLYFTTWSIIFYYIVNHILLYRQAYFTIQSIRLPKMPLALVLPSQLNFTIYSQLHHLTI